MKLTIEQMEKIIAWAKGHDVDAVRIVSQQNCFRDSCEVRLAMRLGVKNNEILRLEGHKTILKEIFEPKETEI